MDRAGFVVALADRLRRGGVPVALSAMTAFSQVLSFRPPTGVDSLYWSARLTLVSRAADLEVFDRVFRAAFEDACLDLETRGQELGGTVPAKDPDGLRASGMDPGGDGSEMSLPWHTLPRTTPSEESYDESRLLPELMPSALQGLGDVPFDRLDPDDLAIFGRWLERSIHRWPSRRSRRSAVSATGRRIALRDTMRAARRTAWEPVSLRRHRPVTRPVPLLLVTDVSQSMRGFATAYLHMMRAFAQAQIGTAHRCETFAFSTSLTRLTPTLALRSPEQAIDRATHEVVDRYGGTHLATSLGTLLRSRHGNLLRGGVLVIASDGWDSDPPEDLAAVMARVRRRARRVVWLNPRAAAPGFEPLVGSMAAALPYCDAFLPGHTPAALSAVFDAMVGV
jgi:uncharacterized protein